MTTTYIDVEKQAQLLSKEEQAKLVNTLLAALAPPLDPAIEADWLHEVAEREAQYLKGEATLIDADTVFAKARKQLK
jgi:hypothetical protein